VHYAYQHSHRVSGASIQWAKQSERGSHGPGNCWGTGGRKGGGRRAGWDWTTARWTGEASATGEGMPQPFLPSSCVDDSFGIFICTVLIMTGCVVLLAVSVTPWSSGSFSKSRTMGLGWHRQDGLSTGYMTLAWLWVLLCRRYGSWCHRNASERIKACTGLTFPNPGCVPNDIHRVMNATFCSKASCFVEAE